MNALEAIYQRRAVKYFDPSHELTPAEEQELLQATIQAPTSFNIQHWRFVIFRDPDLRARLRKEFGNDQARITAMPPCSFCSRPMSRPGRRIPSGTGAMPHRKWPSYW